MICYRCLHVAEPKIVIKKGRPFFGCQKCEGIIFMDAPYLRVMPSAPRPHPVKLDDVVVKEG